VAISTTGDPTGSYNRYSFQYSNFPDYPKLGVWPDAYYVTMNMFVGGQSFAGPEMCAWYRAKMLAGQPATHQRRRLWRILELEVAGDQSAEQQLAAMPPEIAMLPRLGQEEPLPGCEHV